jgi:hypothetical protein
VFLGSVGDEFGSGGGSASRAGSTAGAGRIFFPNFHFNYGGCIWNLGSLTPLETSVNRYSSLDKLLHWTALSTNLATELQFDIERAFYSEKAIPSTRPVFVSGLARAGTTTLMRALFDTGEFATLTYRDMPFVMAPNSWQKLSKGSRRAGEAVIRAHGDGILVDFDSPEALEEVFWRTFCGDEYIKPNSLVAHHVPQAIIDRFKTYVSLVCLARGSQRYLSKNNNNILRLDALRTAFPDCTILVPFRLPTRQASSLLKQNLRFQDQQREDGFTRSYMDWLVHHEFGSDHRPSILNSGVYNKGDTAAIEYWLTYWIDCYGSLYERFGSDRNVEFVCYEDICDPVTKTEERLFEFLGVNAPPQDTFRTSNIHEEVVSSPGPLGQRSADLYQHLQQRSRTIGHNL